MSKEGVKCRVTKDSHRMTKPLQAYPDYLPTGKEVLVELPLGEGELKDWETWLEPLDPADAPNAEAPQPRIPTPGSIAEIVGTTDPSEMTLDDKRALLIVEAIEALDPDAEKGWNREGYATQAHVQGFIAKRMGTGPPRWVTAVLIKSVTDAGSD